MTAATGIGARVLRTEDKRFLTGTGRYVDDLPLARATYAYAMNKMGGGLGDMRAFAPISAVWEALARAGGPAGS